MQLFINYLSIIYVFFSITNNAVKYLCTCNFFLFQNYFLEIKERNSCFSFSFVVKYFIVKLTVPFSENWCKNFSTNEIEKWLPFILLSFEIMALIDSKNNVLNILNPCPRRYPSEIKSGHILNQLDLEVIRWLDHRFFYLLDHKCFTYYKWLEIIQVYALKTTELFLLRLN